MGSFDCSLYAGSEGDRVKRINPDNGEEETEFYADGYVETIDESKNGEYIYYGDTGGTLHKIDYSGLTQWEFTGFGSVYEVELGPGENYIYVVGADTSSPYESVKRIDTDTGNVDWGWSDPDGNYYFYSLAVGTSGDYIYVGNDRSGSKEGVLFKLAASDGTMQWSNIITNNQVTGIAAGGESGYIYVNDDGEGHIEKYYTSNGGLDTSYYAGWYFYDLAMGIQDNYVYSIGDEFAGKYDTAGFTRSWKYENTESGYNINNIRSIDTGKNNEYVYVGEYTDTFRQLNISDGSIRWTFTGFSNPVTSAKAGSILPSVQDSGSGSSSTDVPIASKIKSDTAYGSEQLLLAFKQFIDSDSASGLSSIRRIFSLQDSASGDDTVDLVKIIKSEFDSASGSMSFSQKMSILDSATGSSTSDYSNMKYGFDSASGSMDKTISYDLKVTNISSSSNEGLFHADVILESKAESEAEQRIYETIPVSVVSVAGSMSAAQNTYENVNVVPRNVAQSTLGVDAVEDIERQATSQIVGTFMKGEIYIWTQFEVIEKEDNTTII